MTIVSGKSGVGEAGAGSWGSRSREAGEQEPEGGEAGVGSYISIALVLKPSSLMIFTPIQHRVELKIERNIGEN